MNAKAATCPSDELLADYGLGKLDSPGAETIHQHLETCVDCRSVVAGLSGDSFVDRLREAEAQPPMADAPAQRIRTFAAGESIPNVAKGSETPPPASGKRELAGALPTGKPSGSPGPANVPPELANHPDYEFLKELGRGGMGIVYLARNRMMDRLEVLKVVSKSLLDRPGALERFQQEIRAAAKLGHPNIVAAYTVLRPGDLLVFAMEYVDGQDLSQVVKQRGALPVTNATSYVQQVALGLQHAHDKGMVHRDIKPNNLMLAIVNKRHVVKILDFGLAKATSEKAADGGLTKSGQMMGTPDYIAPEQSLDAQKADIRADIYSLGCTLYYLLAGHTPFRGNSLYEILQAHHQTEARPLNLERPEVPAELAAIVSKMMAKDPARRFQTPMEVAKALNPFFKIAPQAAAKPDALLPPVVSMAPQSAAPAAAAAPAEPVAQPAPVIVQPIRLATAQSVPIAPLPLNSLAGIEATASRPRTKARAKRRRVAMPVAVGLLLVGLIGLGAVMFKFRTIDGVVAIEVNEPNPHIFVDGNQATVTWGAGGTKAEITLPAGSRKIELKKDGFKATGETVELESGGRRVLVARLERNPPSPLAREEPRASRPSAPAMTPATMAPPIAAALPSISSGTAHSAMIPPAAASDGFVSLFNGRDLTGWKTYPGQPGNWRVENGALIGSGPETTHLYSERGDYENFQLRAEARITGYGGVRFRSDFGPAIPWDAPEYPLGYGAQINTDVKTGAKTGLFCVGFGYLVEVPRSSIRRNEWFTMEVIADDDHLVVKVNGSTTADYTDGRWRHSRGHVALEQGKMCSIEFRKIEIKELSGSHRIDPGDRFAAETERASVTYKSAIKRASDKLAAAFPAALKSLSSPRLTAEERVKLIAAVKAEKAAFELAGCIPWSATMRDATQEYLAGIAVARSAFAKSLDKAIDFYSTKQDDAKVHAFLAIKRQTLAPQPLAECRLNWKKGNSGRQFLFSDGLTSDGAAWTIAGDILTWVNPAGVPEGVVTCNIAPDGKTMSGKNNGGNICQATIVLATPKADFPDGQEAPSAKAALPSGAPAAGQPNDGFVPLFNGRDLTGWTRKDGPMKFEVQDGTIVGTALPNTPQGFLCTARDYANFILKLEFKVDDGLNSGIQIRSQSLPGYKNGRVHGYQVEIDATERFYTGALYDEGRRGVFLDDLSKSPTARSAFRKNAWNELRIECQGDSIKTWVNGWPAADCQDSLTSAGFVALQVHAIRGETPLQVRFRKIEIKELTSTKPASTAASTPIGAPMASTPAAATGGFVPLFNGRNLTGWKTHPDQPGGWRVENGVLVGSGPARSHLFSERDDFKDFHLRAEARINSGGNSGITFRTPFGFRAQGWLTGYEAQINSDGRDPNKTGSLYLGNNSPPIAVSNSPVPANQWFLLEVIAVDNRIVIKVDGNSVLDFTDDQRRYSSGHLALQLHDPQTVVKFRRIEVRDPTSAKTPAIAKADPIADRLDKAKATYQDRLEKLKDGLLKGLDKKEAAARATGDKAGLERIQQERTNLTASGAVPTLVPVGDYIRQLRAAHVQLESAYGVAIKAYTKTKQDDQAAAIDRELAEFHRHLPHPDDAKEFAGRFYKVFPQQLSWHEAQAACIEMGGHLAIVRSAVENQFLAERIQAPGLDTAWIGATDEKIEGQWIWVDGAAMQYSNWDPLGSQPNNKLGSEHYAVLRASRGGKWCDQPDRSVEHQPGFICQWD